MKVNRKYLNGTPDLSEYVNLITQIGLTQKLLNELVPRSVDLSMEITNDCVFINDDDGRPLSCMSMGEGPAPEYIVEAFALDLKQNIDRKKI